MSTVKRIICLANSRKLNGRCIAGIEFSDTTAGPWIRPVSDREHGEVSEYERQYKDGSDPRVLDIMDVPLLGPRPKGCQQENWLLDPNEYWVKVGQVTWDDLGRLAETSAPLWINGNNTYNGRNDKVPLPDADGLDSSLRFVHADRVTLSVFKPGEAFGNPKRRVQGRFRYHGSEYKLWITDPRYERRFLQKSDGDYELGESYLTVSLGEPHNNACYKLIAAIVEPGRGSLG